MSDSQIRSGRQIRQDFLDFFQSKRHSIVPSDNLGYQSRDGAKIFTNAGMNQFVPIFLGERKPDVNAWPGAVTDKNSLPTRAADTQKCIRAGGKHNDLDDVGLDTYHHTFFEMLGNWSFGDYFKKEAIEWAWELLTKVWHFPKERLYATVYKPGDGDPAEFDQEAYDLWADIFRRAGLDPEIHVVYGGKDDNFWKMADTGPCGPCSELHIDLTQQGDTKGALVNKDSSECIEIWNLVFIQLNANPDGGYSPLPAQHVDTGMGFERVCSVIQNTRGFTDFKRGTSNYETDVFRPIFDKLEELSGKKYTSTLPREGAGEDREQEQIDVAFRVIADHIRTLSFSIADGLIPGRSDRNYTLRRILRRAVRYGRLLGFDQPFFHQLADVLVAEMGDVFPELREKQRLIKTTINNEEISFNTTLDRGIEMFNELAAKGGDLESSWRRALSFRLHNRGRIWALRLSRADGAGELSPGEILSEDQVKQIEGAPDMSAEALAGLLAGNKSIPASERAAVATDLRAQLESFSAEKNAEAAAPDSPLITAFSAFELSDTYGFPTDLTELMAREVGGGANKDGADAYIELQKELSRESRGGGVINVTDLGDLEPTRFSGFEALSVSAAVREIVEVKGKTAVILDATPCYAEMGGQLGDSGVLSGGGNLWRIANTNKNGDVWLHLLDGDAEGLEPGMEVEVAVDAERRAAIERHHSVTHVFHWALHEVAGREATQKGSYVGPDKLTFDFNSAALTPQQVHDIERIVNERIVDNAPISWTEVPYAELSDNQNVMQLFGEKYGETVRVVQIGGKAGDLDGYSMELCGGTHTKATGEIGSFRILGESAIAAGTRRIEAIAGLQAYHKSREETELIAALAGKLNSPIGELEKKLENLVAQQKQLEKQLKAMKQKQAGAFAQELLAKARDFGAHSAIIENLGEEDGNYCQAIADALKGEFNGIVVLAGSAGGSVALVATVAKELTGSVRAGDIIKTIAPIVGGKGGGKPEQARGGGKDVSKINEALERAEALLAS